MVILLTDWDGHEKFNKDTASCRSTIVHKAAVKEIIQPRHTGRIETHHEDHRAYRRHELGINR